MAEVAATDRTRSAPERELIGRLLARGWEFAFFQAVWLLEQTAGDHVPVGGRGPVARERLRFRPDPGLSFPPVDVLHVQELIDSGTGQSFYRVDVTFMGLYGVSTPLPLHYAVSILRSVEPALDKSGQVAAPAPGEGLARPAGSTPVRDFLDLLHHRLLSLFYRAWTKYRYHVTFAMPGRDVMSDYFLWLIGCSPKWGAADLGVEPIRMLRYAGLFTQRPRTGAGLEGLLFDYWGGVPTQVEQCVGRWVTLKPEDLNRAGLANSALGVDLTVGEQVYDLNGCFNVVIGPMDWPAYLSFLPDGSRFAQTEALVRLYQQDPLACSIEIRLQAGEVPEMMLSSDDRAGRLGYTSWVRTAELPETSVRFGAMTHAAGHN